MDNSKLLIADTLINHMREQEYAKFKTDTIANKLKIGFIDALNELYKKEFSEKSFLSEYAKIDLGSHILELADKKLNPPDDEYGNLEIDHTVGNLYSVFNDSNKMDAHYIDVANIFLKTGITDK